MCNLIQPYCDQAKPRSIRTMSRFLAFGVSAFLFLGSCLRAAAPADDGQATDKKDTPAPQTAAAGKEGGAPTELKKAASSEPKPEVKSASKSAGSSQAKPEVKAE